MLAELIVADQSAERLTAKDSKLLFIDFFEKSALVEFRSALQVAEDLLLADVEHADF